MLTRSLARVALPVLALSACMAEEPRQTDADPTEDTLRAPPYNQETLPPDSQVLAQRGRPQAPRAETLVDSIAIEGQYQPDRLTLVRSPDGFSPPFTTYLPSQMRVEFARSDSTPSVRFITAFAGQVNPDAYLQVKFYPAGSAELVARAAVDVYLRGRDPRQSNVSRSAGWPWTLEAFDFQYGAGPGQSGFMGTIGLARHVNRYFHVLAHYPADYGDGVGPRFGRILQEWRWEDDGTRLVPSR